MKVLPEGSLVLLRCKAILTGRATDTAVLTLLHCCEGGRSLKGDDSSKTMDTKPMDVKPMPDKPMPDFKNKEQVRE